jgi:hypothetical protein
MEIKTPAWVPEYMTLKDWVDEVLDLMSERPVEITRAKAKYFCRVILGRAALRDLPRGKGRRIFRINGSDALVLDYAKPSRRFKPSWVKGRVRRGAFRTTLRPALRLELLVTGWFGPLFRWSRIGGHGPANGSGNRRLVQSSA